jgi:hypothetical protein
MTDTTNTTETEEIKEAEKSGVVDFADKKEENKPGNYTHTFSKPVEIEGVKYTKLTFYFESLTGEDIEAVEEELQDQNKYVLTPEISSAFQSTLAARAAKVPADEIRRLPLRDYMQIKTKARNFLVNMG